MISYERHISTKFQMQLVHTIKGTYIAYHNEKNISTQSLKVTFVSKILISCILRIDLSHKQRQL